MSDYNPWYDPEEDAREKAEKSIPGMKILARRTDYGQCVCGADLEPVWCEEEEWKAGVYTGRVRTNMNYLICPVCMKKECVDGDSFAGPWRRKTD